MGISSDEPVVSGSPIVGGLVPEDTEEDAGFSFIGWKILSTIVLIIGAAIFSAMIVYFKKQAKSEEEDQVLAGPGESPLKDIVDILQSEAHKREVVISAGALKVLMEKTHSSITEGVLHLHKIIDELKKILPPIPEVSSTTEDSSGTGRWLAIDVVAVEKHFAAHK